MGVNTAMVYSGGDARPWLENQFPYYVENIINRGLCLKFSSQVRNWDKFVTDWAKTRDPAKFVRDYCLDDPAWREWAKKEMRAVVEKNRAHQPLAYDIRDELSTTISANPFDYDFSPICLEQFRDWLKTQYSDLAELNREWQSQFGSWTEVIPFTTDQIKQRMAGGQNVPQGPPDWPALQRLKFSPAMARASPTRWNFSPWADFRTYMDISLARAVGDLRSTAHDLDPQTPVGIEGTQMPSAFGGYDLGRLAQVLDWVEPYDIANAREIFGSFMPGKPLLTTVFESDALQAGRRLWHLLLAGDRGCIIWWSKECIDWQSADYALTPKAKALAPVMKEMTSPLAQLFLRAERQFDPIAIHYSQASIQAGWLIESCPDGSTWLRRFSSFEADHNRQARVRNSWVKALQDAGFTPRFVSSTQIESGELARGKYQVLVMPNSLALSDQEAERIDGFLTVNQGRSSNMILCDGTPGLFDQHGRLRPQSPLEKYFPAANSEACVYGAHGGQSVVVKKQEADIASYAKERLGENPSSAWPGWIAQNMAWTPPMTLRMPGNSRALPRASIHRYRLGRAQLAAVERNIDYHMSEDLKQAGGNQNLEKPIELEVRFAASAHIYDLQTGIYLGQTDHFTFVLNPWHPSLFALLDEPVPAKELISRLLNERPKTHNSVN